MSWRGSFYASTAKSAPATASKSPPPMSPQDIPQAPTPVNPYDVPQGPNPYDHLTPLQVKEELNETNVELAQVEAEIAEVASVKDEPVDDATDAPTTPELYDNDNCGGETAKEEANEENIGEPTPFEFTEDMCDDTSHWAPPDDEYEDQAEESMGVEGDHNTGETTATPLRARDKRGLVIRAGRKVQARRKADIERNMTVLEEAHRLMSECIHTGVDVETWFDKQRAASRDKGMGKGRGSGRYGQWGWKGGRRGEWREWQHGWHEGWAAGHYSSSASSSSSFQPMHQPSSSYSQLTPRPPSVPPPPHVVQSQAYDTRGMTRAQVRRSWQ